MKVDLDALDALEQRATPGGWRLLGDHLVELPLRNRKYPEGHIRWCPSLTYEHNKAQAANAALIVALRNAAPLILPVVVAAVEWCELADNCDDATGILLTEKLLAAVRALVGAGEEGDDGNQPRDFARHSARFAVKG